MQADKKTRILFMIGAYGTGGKERQLAELIKGLPCDEFEMHLFIKTEGAHYLDDIMDKLSSIHSLNRKRFGRKALADISGIIDLIKPDIVHSWADTTSFYAALARLFSRKKYLLIDGSIRMAPEKVKKLSVSNFQRKIINVFCDIIVANSKSGLQTYKVPSAKSLCIYNGFDGDRLVKLKDPEQIKKELGIETRYNLGMVARFNWEKDWPTFFTAVEKVLESRNDVTFLAVGGGVDLDKFRDNVKLPFRNRIIFTGERNDVESIVNVIDIGILSSYSEGISNSVIEYMALGKPVIASGYGGIPELIIHNETGLVFPVGDFNALVEDIMKLLDNKDLREKMGRAGKRRIEEEFSFDRFIQAYKKLYKNALCAV
jgi:glycosyltransferase involved in cell wall biosynthesis